MGGIGLFVNGRLFEMGESPAAVTARLVARVRVDEELNLRAAVV